MWVSKSKNRPPETPPGEQSYYLINNPYGYRINIRNPVMGGMLTKYKQRHNIPAWVPLSDVERRVFESCAMWQLKGRENPKYQKTK